MKTFHVDHPQAATAIYAAAHRHKWGRYASARYAAKRGVPMRLYLLACQLHAVTKEGF